MYRFGLGLAAMLAMGFVDIRFYLRWGYLVYIVALVLLVAVELVGMTGMGRSEEHTSELQSLMRSSYAVFCLKKKIHHVVRTHGEHTYRLNRQIGDIHHN